MLDLLPSPSPLQSVAVGLVMGLLLIVGLSVFPGQPFDYDADLIDHQALAVDTKHQGNQKKGNKIVVRKASKTIDQDDDALLTVRQRQREQAIDVAARQVRVDKLQELLGLEAQAVQDMIAQAKADAIADPARGSASSSSSSSSSPRQYARYLDLIVLSVLLLLLALVLRAEYNVNLLAVVAFCFPRETATLQQLVASLPSWPSVAS